jgi:hypothetical protein
VFGILIDNSLVIDLRITAELWISQARDASEIADHLMGLECLPGLRDRYFGSPLPFDVDDEMFADRLAPDGPAAAAQRETIAEPGRVGHLPLDHIWVLIALSNILREYPYRMPDLARDDLAGTRHELHLLIPLAILSKRAHRDRRSPRAGASSGGDR